MKLIFCLISVLGVRFSWSQIPPFADCGNAMYVCDGDSIPLNTFTYGFVDELSTNQSNPSSNPNGGNSGCLLAGENKSNWIILTVATSGTLAFSLHTNTSTLIDWIMWPYDSTTCFQIFAGNRPPVACNWNGVSNGLSGLANSGNLPIGGSIYNFESEINVLAGDEFVICFNVGPVTDFAYFSSFGTAQLCGTPSDVDCANSSLIITDITVTPTCSLNCTGQINLNAIDVADSISFSIGALSNYSGLFSNLCSGTYTVQVEDSIGCVQYGNVVLQNLPLFTPSVMEDTIYACDYFCDQISGFGIQNYIWFGDSILSTQQMFTYCDSVPTVLYLTGTDTQGCMTDTIGIVFENQEYGINSIYLTATQDTVPFGGTSNICLPADLPMISYLWDNNETTNCITVTPVDSITQCVTLTDSCGRVRELCYTIYAESNIGMVEFSLPSAKLKTFNNGFCIQTADDGMVEFILLDSFGKQVFNDKNYYSEQIINTDFLANGLYYVFLLENNFYLPLQYTKF